MVSIHCPSQQIYPRYFYIVVLHSQFCGRSYFWGLSLLWCGTASGFLLLQCLLLILFSFTEIIKCNVVVGSSSGFSFISITAASFWITCFSCRIEASAINSANFTRSPISFSVDDLVSFDDLDLWGLFDTLEFPFPLSEIYSYCFLKMILRWFSVQFLSTSNAPYS